MNRVAWQGIREQAKVFFFSLFLGLAQPGMLFAKDDAWKNIAPGIDYYDNQLSYLTPWSHLHSFKLDLHRYKLSLATAKEFGKQYASVDYLAQQSKALVAINGGFFAENYLPLGLRIHNSKQSSPIKPISWWGVFYTKGTRAEVSSMYGFRRVGGIDFAVQSGPRLLVNGRIPPLRAGRAERSALCISKRGEVIVLVTEHSPLSTTELAQVIRKAPYHCLNALNLDGGSSSQLFAALPDFQLHVHGFASVSDAVIVKLRHPQY